MYLIKRIGHDYGRLGCDGRLVDATGERRAQGSEGRPWISTVGDRNTTLLRIIQKTKEVLV